MKANQFDENYYQKYNSTQSWKHEFIRRIDRKEPMLTALKREFPVKSKLLDFGCGAGKFISLASDYFECTGVEQSEYAYNQAKKNARIKVIMGNEHKLKILPNKYFDIVTIFDVLEHNQKPQNILKAIRPLVKSQGKMLVAVPNLKSMAKTRNQENWWGFSDMTHITLLSPREWRTLIESTGFTYCRTYSSGLIDYPEPPYALKGRLKYLHFASQTLVLWGVPLPYYLNDELIEAYQRTT